MYIYQYRNLFENPQTSYCSRNCTTRGRYKSFLNVLIKSCFYTRLFFFFFLFKVWTTRPTLLWHISSSSLTTWANPKGFLFMHIEVHMFVSLNKHLSKHIKDQECNNYKSLCTKHTYLFFCPAKSKVIYLPKLLWKIKRREDDISNEAQRYHNFRKMLIKSVLSKKDQAIQTNINIISVIHKN